MSLNSETELAILVALARSSSEASECENSLSELERLADTAGAEVFCKVIQIKESPDARTLIGSGKVAEIAELVKNNGISLVIFDCELSPMQIRNLEELIGATVIDRSMLILDIFAKHAKSGEGKLQVELAQLKYSAPRLVGKGKELSRQGGGIGSRGPGESKLETDRRHLKERIATLEARHSELEHTRAIMRAQRDRSRIPKVALVGYTNAGKSTLLNAITDAGVLCEDKLFATLDPTTRKAALPSGESILLTDTVGFIRKLPHQLVKAFKSTLDEVRYADILLVTVDSSDHELLEHIAVTEEVITELSASEKPRIYVYNKADLSDNSILRSGERSVAVSARTGAGIEELMLLIERIIKESKREVELIIPYSVQSAVSNIYNEYTVLSCEYIDTGARIRVVLDERGLGLYKKFIVE